ncbi:hypothetical protein N1027_11125 [Herbiconiux sp. CPCC 205763]|uniref:Integral membrane protein n=1 Tax=Herbiconiux aconitum TaxID=2970913 RepID=A0ABT2GR35_9MICO|nr:hypothetical protein [Herbiconiux aconitum]MCS5718685.1 hypothetical protein [Herbiconiux aconitum]
MSDDELSGPEFTDEPALLASPLEVKISFWLWIAEGILTVIGGLGFALIAGAIPLVVGVENSEAAALVGLFITAGVLIALVAVLRIVCAVFMLRGRVWARNTLTVLGVIGLVGVYYEFLSNPGTAIAHALVAVVAIVTMYLPNSNAYFRRPFPASEDI